jgi:hypothetical protein
MKRVALLVVLLTAVLAAGAATAVATPSSVFGSSGSSQAAGPTLGSVSVKYKVGKFVKSGKALLAKGTVTATYTPQTGAPTTVTQPFTAKATFSRKWRIASTGSEQRICQVLTLQLGPLHLNLLGLIVDLSPVNLRITANSNGGLLGSLFCSIANRNVTLATRSNARKLTTAVQKSGLATRGVGFTMPVSQIQAQQGPCQVLDLVLGPLHLDLLGLIVDLNQIHLQITADPNGGLLGSLLCSLTAPPTTAVPRPSP